MYVHMYTCSGIWYVWVGNETNWKGQNTGKGLVAFNAYEHIMHFHAGINFVWRKLQHRYNGLLLHFLFPVSTGVMVYQVYHLKIHIHYHSYQFYLKFFVLMFLQICILKCYSSNYKKHDTVKLYPRDVEAYYFSWAGHGSDKFSLKKGTSYIWLKLMKWCRQTEELT